MSARRQLSAAPARLMDPLFLSTGAVIFVTDQVTKSIILSTLGSSGPRSVEVLGDYVRLSFVTNSGSAFGLVQNSSGVIAMISLLIVPALFFSRAFLSDPGLLVRLCLGLLVGGALGNLVDRLRLGYVIDFVDVGIGNLRWPAFNVADSAFVVGVITLIALTTVLGQTLDRSANTDLGHQTQQDPIS